MPDCAVVEKIILINTQRTIKPIPNTTDLNFNTIKLPFMKEQNFKNHAHYVTGWHFITPIVLLAIFIGSIRNLIYSDSSNLYSASLVVAISVILWLIWFYERVFALKAQDRAICAEENFTTSVSDMTRLFPI